MSTTSPTTCLQFPSETGRGSIKSIVIPSDRQTVSGVSLLYILSQRPVSTAKGLAASLTHARPGYGYGYGYNYGYGSIPHTYIRGISLEPYHLSLLVLVDITHVSVPVPVPVPHPPRSVLSGRSVFNESTNLQRDHWFG